MPRGGTRPGAGRKKKPLAEKILDGNPSRRPLQVVEFYGVSAEGVLTPPEFLKIASKETADNYPTADEIYMRVAEWLQSTGVAHLISPMLIEDFAMNRRAYFETEYMNKKMGRIASGKRSPYVDMMIQYSGLMRVAWDRIWSIVAQNSEKSYGGQRPNSEDILEQLLSGRRD